MVLKSVKTSLSYLLLESGFLVRILLPVLRLFVKVCAATFGTFPNHYITDENGHKLKAMKLRGRIYPPFGLDFVTKIKNLRLRKSDVFLCGYPKTGCHWTYEILYMLLNKNTEISKYGKGLGGMLDALPKFIIDCLPTPRILNTHLLYNQLPPDIITFKNKIILTERNPKDTVVSFYHHHKNMKHVYGDYNGNFPDYFKMFMNKELDYGCYFDYTTDWYSIISSKPENDIFLLRYEDLKKDPMFMIKKLANFLEISISDDIAEQIAEKSSFSGMKKARSGDGLTSKIFRKGTVGDWKNWLTEEQAKQIDEKWEKIQIEFGHQVSKE